SPAWAGEAVLHYRCAAGDWAGALAALENMKGALARGAYRRQRAVLLTAQAQALDATDRDQARALILEAVKLAPDLTPAAAMAGRRLAEAGEQRKARRILEAAWAAKPHPDIAEAYAHVRLGASARERLARVQKLAAMAPGHIESAIAIARAALDAHEFATARAALTPYLRAPTRRIAMLMADIEAAEHGDEGRVREWMARAMRAAADPAWTADNVVSDRWLPVTPRGELDGFVWKVPLAEIGTPSPEPFEPLPELKGDTASEVKTESEVQPAQPAAPERSAKPAIAIGDKSAVARPADPIIPLVHAPDDPGPNAHIEADPVPEHTTPAGTWRRFVDLFRYSVQK